MSNRKENRNISAYIGMDTLSGMTLLLSTGALWQGLLLHYGMSSAQVGILTSAASIVQAVAMFLNIYITDRVRSPIRTMTLCNLPVTVFFLLMTVLCFLGQPAFVFPLLMGAVIVYNFFHGLRGIISYKIPFLVFRMENYGRITAVDGVCINIFTTLASMGIPILLEHWDYGKGMQLLFACAALAAIGKTVLNGTLRPLPGAPAGEQRSSASSLSALLKEKSVRALFLPNFLRGISMGIVGSIALIAAHGYTRNSSELAMLVSAGTVASILGNGLFTFFARERMVKVLCLLSSGGMLIFSAALIFPKSWTLFLILYLLLYICYTIVNSTVPVLVAQFIPYRVIGGYSSLRMMITTAGTAVSSMIVGVLMEHAPSGDSAFTILLLLVCGLTQLYSGWAYYRYVKKEWV